MSVIRNALIAAMLLALIPTPQAAATNQLDEYEFVWDTVYDDLNCGWSLAENAAREGNQSFLANRIAGARVETDSRYTTFVKTVRPVTDPAAAQVAWLDEEGREQLINDAWGAVIAAKCLVVKNYVNPTHNTIVRVGPIYCYYVQTLSCGWNVTTCNVDLLFDVADDVLWGRWIDARIYAPPGVPNSAATRPVSDCNPTWNSPRPILA